MINYYHEFAPREWVMQNMTCQRATELLSQHIRTYACRIGEKWHNDLAVKLSHVNTLKYWNDKDPTNKLPFQPSGKKVTVRSKWLSAHAG